MHFTSTFGLLASLLVVAVQGIDPSWPKDAITHCRNGHAAMSFDDGPTPLTRSIVDQLVAAKQHATFFVNVNNYDCNYKPEYVSTLRHAVANKMTLASHTAGHPHMLNLTDDQIRFQIIETNKFLKRTVGVKPKFIRFPYGETNDRVERITRQFGMQAIYWSKDTEDSMGGTEADAVQVFKDLGSKSTDIILMHDTHKRYVHSTMPKILEALKSQQIKSSGMAKCFGLAKYEDAYTYYQPHNNPPTADWNCDNIPIGNPK